MRASFLAVLTTLASFPFSLYSIRNCSDMEKVSFPRVAPEQGVSGRMQEWTHSRGGVLLQEGDDVLFGDSVGSEGLGRPQLCGVGHGGSW